jgi:hypothetical protein
VIIWISQHSVAYEGNFDISYHMTEAGANKARQKLINKEKKSIRDCFDKPFGPGEKEEYKRMMDRQYGDYEVFSTEVEE